MRRKAGTIPQETSDLDACVQVSTLMSNVEGPTGSLVELLLEALEMMKASISLSLSATFVGAIFDPLSGKQASPAT